MTLTQGKHFEFEILDRPTFSYIKVLMKEGQEIKTERGSMMFMEPTLEIQTKKAEKGFLKSLKRTLAGETLLMNYIRANGNGWLALCPPFAGDIMHIPLEQGETWQVFSGGYIGSSVNLSQSTRFQGMKRGLLSQERAFILSITADNGPGDLFIGANGSFLEWTLQPGQILNVDNGHLVAMSASVQMDIKRVGSWKSTILSGEGVVCQMTGPGKVIIQSRNPQEFANWMYRLMPHDSSN